MSDVLVAYNAAAADASAKAKTLMASLTASDADFLAASELSAAANERAIAEWDLVLTNNPTAVIAWNLEQQRRFDAHQECGLAPGVGLTLAQRLLVMDRQSRIAA